MFARAFDREVIHPDHSQEVWKSESWVWCGCEHQWFWVERGMTEEEAAAAVWDTGCEYLN